MKRLISCLAIALFLYSDESGAIDVTQYMSGSWYNSTQSGHGFSVEVISQTRAIFYWFVYNPDGTPTFLIAVGDIDGDTIEATAYFNTGMRWDVFDPDELTEVVWGTISIKFHDCGTATMTYNSSHEIEGIPSGMGSIDLTRLEKIYQMQCNDNPFAGIYQGSLTSNQTAEISAATVMLSSTGKLISFSLKDSLSYGDYSVGGFNLSMAGVAFAADGESDWSSNGTALGRIMADYRIIYNYNFVAGESGTGNLYSINSLYRRGVTLEEIEDDWISQNLITDQTGAATIMANGTFALSDDLGCDYDGAIQIPDENFNLFEVTLTVTSCSDLNGDYVGMGHRTDAQNLGDNDLVRIYATDLSNPLAIQLTR